MKNLLIMRHAKSDWNHENSSDFERPLNKRGIKAAPFMGKEIKKRNKIPDIIISSPANRAKTTAKLFAEKSDYTKEIIFEKDFYFGHIENVIDKLKSIDSSIDRIMIVGHNPTWEHFVTELSKNYPYVTMPTAAIASINFDIENWSDLKYGIGNLEWLIKPKELQNSNW